MATQVNGYQHLLTAEYDTYDHWRSYALSHGVNVDFAWGNQCWDICALLWYQYGLRLQTGNGYAYGCWTERRNQNAQFPFELVIHIADIKKGDCVVFAPSGLNYTGHIAFADENYNGTRQLNCLGQNQGQGNSSGTPSNVRAMNLTNFLGAFRNTKWKQETPPTPSGSGETSTRNKFPFVLYAKKFRKFKR